MIKLAKFEGDRVSDMNISDRLKPNLDEQYLVRLHSHLVSRVLSNCKEADGMSDIAIEVVAECKSQLIGTL